MNGRYLLFHVGMGFDAAVVERVERRASLKRWASHPLFAFAAIDTVLRHYDRSRPRLSVHLPDGKQGSIYDAAMQYKAEKVPLIILAGREYGTGSSRDWAAKGTLLLGVKAVIAESFERIHRSNLIGMGVAPLQFLPGQNAASLGLTGRELFSIEGLSQGDAREVKVTAVPDSGKPVTFKARLRIDTPKERDYYRHGGILQYVLRQLAASGGSA